MTITGVKLHAPIKIGSTLVRNRLYRAPVLEGAGSGPDAPRIYAEAFEANARAGVGLIIQGNSCITDEGRHGEKDFLFGFGRVRGPRCDAVDGAGTKLNRR